MSFSGYRAKNHPQQQKLRGADAGVDDRRTPDDFWCRLNEVHNFTLDVAATADNSKTDRWCEDGLEESWEGETVWCNPPYSDIRPWVEKAHAEIADGCLRVVMLLPANRCEQQWWQDLIEPYRDRPDRDPLVRTTFLAGRMRFDRPGWKTPEKGNRPPFGVVLVVLERNE